jgi:beta-glucosidase
LLFLALCAVDLTICSVAQENAGDSKSVPVYLDPRLPIEQRVDDLVSRMTVEEKASQLVNQARAIPRLDVPAYDYWSEALHGVGFAGTATVFPQAIALAATWDAPLLHDVATVIGTEARAKHHEALRQSRRDIFEGLTFWSPNVNIFRDPRWGRGQETYGEDPFLTAHMGVAFVTGLQGDDPKYLRVVATPKHFAVHSGPESLRHKFDVPISKHDEEDTYLPAFRAAIIEGHAASIMCAYNSINGEPACANNFLLRDQLRGAWQFKGFVVSDCGAVVDIWNGHHYAKTKEEAAAVSLKMGMDNECIDYTDKILDNSDYVKYLDALKSGLLSEKDMEVALRRLFRARFLLGMFDPLETVPYAKIPYSENDSELHRQLALTAAREGMVLLKNDGLLPLKARTRKIAVVGPLADQARVLEGNYNGTPSRVTTILQGIQKQFPNSHVTFEPGTIFLRSEGNAVPTSLLSTVGGERGLKGEYFQGTDLQGAPVVTRTDSNVDFVFTGKSPAPGLDPVNFSIRWTGFLEPKKSGNYQLGVNADDGYRLWMDGKLLVEDWTSHAPSQQLESVNLLAGHKYALKLEYFQGTGGASAQLVWSPSQNSPLKKAVKVARKSDVVIAVVGITSDLEGEESSVNQPGFKGGDRTSLDLPQEEEDLLKALKATGKPLVVVLMNGSALAVNWANQNANAILDAWYPGEEGGTAVAETLAGTNNPAGRLPITFYESVEQLPPFEDYSMANRTYRYFKGRPLYQFGYGLSYSSFSYSNLELSTISLNAGDSLEVDADVKDNGCCAGDEVVELYLAFPDVHGAPIRALRGFTRTHLDQGETRHVHFSLSPRDLSLVNEAGDHVVAPGTYRIAVGGGQPGAVAPTLDAAFSITGTLKLPE